MASEKKLTPWPWGVTAGVGLAVLVLLWVTWPRVPPSIPAGVRPVSAPVAPQTSATDSLPPVTATATDAAVATTAPATLPLAASAAIPAKDILTIAVWNGSGTVGAAGRVADIFRGAGYANVSTGNAGAFTYRGTTIQYRPGLRGAAEDLARLLREQTTQFRYQEFATSTPAADVVVIVGK